MKVRNFNDLAEPIRGDPRRAANIERHRAEALRELISYELQEIRLGLTPRTLCPWPRGRGGDHHLPSSTRP